MKKKVKCGCTKSTSEYWKDGRLQTPEGLWIPCPYCEGTMEKTVDVAHPSHNLTQWATEIRCPGSEPRFYGVRHCTKCGREELQHPAGHFLNGLGEPCKGSDKVSF